MAAKPTQPKSTKSVRVEISDASDEQVTVKDVAERIVKMDSYILKARARYAQLEAQLEEMRGTGAATQKLVDQGKKLYQLTSNMEQEA